MAAALAGILAFAGVSQSQAQTTSTWITETISSNGTYNWSDNAKWVGGTAPSTASTVNLDFTNLTINTAVVSPGGDVTLNNNIGAFSVNQLSLARNISTSTGIFKYASATSLNWVRDASLNNPQIVLNGLSTKETWINFNSSVDSGATLQIGGTAAGLVRYLNAIGGAGGVTVNKTNNLNNLTFHGASTYTGGFTLTSGLIGLSISSTGPDNAPTNGPLGRGVVKLNGGTIISAGGASRTLGNSVQIGGDFGVGISGGSYNLTFTGTTLLTGTGITRTITGGFSSFDANQGTLTFAGAISEAGAGNGITFANTASTRIVLSGNNTYTGNTRVNGGTLILGSANALAGSTLNTAGNGTVTYFAGTNNIGGITGNGSVSNGGNLLSIGANGQDTAYSGNMSGTGGLTKVGAGVLTLSGNNTYSGATNVTGGTLLANNTTGSATGTGNVTVAAGATLGGNGTVGGATAIAGILSPGTGGIGTLNITGNATWLGASSNGTATDWIFQLGNSNTADLLNITGNFLKDSVTYGSNFRFDFGGSGNTGIFKLVDWSGTTSFSASDFSFTNLGGGLSGSFAINGSQLDFTAFSAIPEPSTWIGIAALALTAAAMATRRRATVKS